jgi:hypothetical protein
MKNLTKTLTSLKMNEEATIEFNTMAANKIIGIVSLLQRQAGIAFLVGGRDGMITVKRTK